MITPPLGLAFTRTIVIDPTLVVPSLPAAFPVMADMPPVFATAFMVAFIEAICIEALAPYLEGEEGTVGTSVEMSHSGATPSGCGLPRRSSWSRWKDTNCAFASTAVTRSSRLTKAGTNVS